MESHFIRQALAASLFSAATLVTASALGGDGGVNIYGLSYHWDRDLAKQNDLDNEFNPGLGVRYHMGQWLKANAIIDAGAYRDSGRNTAVYAAEAAINSCRVAKTT